MSFQLSFIVALGLVLYAGLLSNSFSAWIGRRLLAFGLLENFANHL